MKDSSITIGIDLGTSSVKALALAPSGSVAGVGRAAFPTRADADGKAEQDPSDWIQAAARAVSMARANVPDMAVSGIGLTGQMPTLVVMGKDGPVGPAITWMDSRADAFAGERLDEICRDMHYQATGMPVDGRYLAPMFACHGSRYKDACRILSAKDYLCHALTGKFATDPSTAAGYGVYGLEAETWAPMLCEHWDLVQAFLPEILPSDTPAGDLTAEGAALLGLPPGIPVYTGAADSVAGALAMSGLQKNMLSISMGSSAIIMDACSERLLDSSRRYLLSPHVRSGWYGREMDLLAAGAGYRWLCDLFGWHESELEHLALAAKPGAGGVFFGPYLAGGEQGALWNPDLQGAVRGLSLGHGPADVARAFIEGTLFEIRRCADVLRETAPLAGAVISGPASESAGMLRLFADVLGFPVRPSLLPSPAAAGAALLAMPDGASLAPCEALGSAVKPEPRRSGTYEDLYRIYLSLFPATAGSF